MASNYDVHSPPVILETKMQWNEIKWLTYAQKCEKTKLFNVFNIKTKQKTKTKTTKIYIIQCSLRVSDVSE